MAYSACPKCNGHYFEMKEAEPANALYKVNFIQCSSCGAVVGVIDYFDLGTLIHKLARALGMTLAVFDLNRLFTRSLVLFRKRRAHEYT